MLQSFVLVDEFENHRFSESLLKESRPEVILKNMGFRVHIAFSDKDLQLIVRKAEAVLLSVAPEQVEPWRKRILSIKSLPILWWCDQRTFPSSECRIDSGIDALLGPGMNALEIHCALLLGVNHYFQRTAWQQEREQLLSRLEERKWIDQAKRILCEIKNISEAEAYEFLRKQAMNERKRMADVATSIVKVYQLLQDENKGGPKR